MKRWIYRHRTVTGRPATLERRLREELPVLLAAAAGHDPNPPAGDGSFLLRIDLEVAGLHLRKTVRVRAGVATGSEGRVAIPIGWDADPLAHSFPGFEGAIELEPLSHVQAQLSVVGSYRLPVGPLGAALDATVLRGVAERAVAQLVDRLARALTDPDLAATTPPSGTSLRVRDVMTPDPLVLDEDLPLRTAALLLFHYDVAGAPVQDGRGRLVGVLSEADLLEKEATPRSGLGTLVGQAATRADRLRSARTVGEAATRPAHVTDACSTLHDAAREMIDHRIARLVVLDDSQVAGIVSRHDILQALIRADEQIQADVDRVRDGMNEHDVALDVEWGRVTATGTISRCSAVGELSSAVAQVDGVMEVDVSALTWQVDDVSFTVPMF
jgi:CBS domain-containing protein